MTYCYREDESAPVNRGLTEVTSHIRRYIWPNKEYAHLALWDLPGGSTNNNRTATYFQDKALYAFDCLLLLSTARFTELDFDIVQQAGNCGTPIVLVLTKVDQEVKNELEENPEKPSQQIVNEIVSEFKQSARKKLAEVHPALANVPIYQRWAAPAPELSRLLGAGAVYRWSRSRRKTALRVLLLEPEPGEGGLIGAGIGVGAHR